MSIRLKLVLLSVAFSALSCGWLEQERIREATLTPGYRIFYDTSNIAFNYISIATDDGTPLLSDCEEVYVSGGSIYAKGVLDNENTEFWRIIEETKTVSRISSKEYLENQQQNKVKVIKFKELQ